MLQNSAGSAPAYSDSLKIKLGGVMLGRQLFWKRKIVGF